MTDKYLSIITNFGCHYTCPYCIVKNNNIGVPVTTLVGLDKLKQVIIENDITIVSVSGGGDPLFEYEKHKGWYDRLFEILNELNIPLEMHTSYLNSDFPYEKCKRVVYHLQGGSRLRSELRWVQQRGNEIVRVVLVVQDNMTEKDICVISELVNWVGAGNFELTFRQRVDSDYKISYHLHDFLKSGHKVNWWYVEQDDYNLYYAENQVYTRYSDFRCA